MELALTHSIALITGILYILSIGLAYQRLKNAQLARGLIATLAAAAVSSGTFALETDMVIVGNLTASGLRVLGLSLTIMMVSHLTPLHLLYKGNRLWLGAGLIWWVALVAVGVTEEPAFLGNPNWLEESFSPVQLSGVLAIGGWTVLGVAMLVQTFYVLYTASLPESANRATFWAATVPLGLMGAILAASGVDNLIDLGLGLEAVGLMGVVYAAVSLQVLDVRRNILRSVSAGIIALLTAGAFALVLIIADRAVIDDDTSRTGFFIGLAALGTLIYTPIRVVLSALLARTWEDRRAVASSLQNFSEALTGVVDMSDLLTIVYEFQRSILQAQRGGLILIQPNTMHSQQDGEFRLAPHRDSDLPQIESVLLKESPIAARLLDERKPLTQFEIDFDPVIKEAAELERNFFKQLRLAAYAPVLVEGEPFALLGAGPKQNGEPYTPQDLDLLSLMANQSGVALKNARLVHDLRHREQEASETSLALKSTKEQLEQLDAVKTDFITIASHELRTPLAQIRGYTDIIDAMNSQGMLDTDQLAGMTNNLRKATDRMEELISNMLDVSQLDVDAMDLRFMQTSVENVVRLAVEPLMDAIRNRKQSLTARDLRGLPEIQADTKRMVQALQNIVLNAVKFTPDAGRIEITGSTRENPQTGGEDVVIAIKDSGIGIDKKNHEIIFEKFVRAHDSKLHSTGKTKFMGAGPGLGLTIARGVIEGHGGKIWVESTGQDNEALPGATFFVLLPTNPPEDATGVMHFEPTLSNFDREELARQVKEAGQEKSE